MSRKRKKKRSSKWYIALRKKLRFMAEARYQRDTSWHGGTLYFTGTKKKVPGVRRLPKPGRQVTSLRAIYPKDESPIAKDLPGNLKFTRKQRRRA